MASPAAESLELKGLIQKPYGVRLLSLFAVDDLRSVFALCKEVYDWAGVETNVQSLLSLPCWSLGFSHCLLPQPGPQKDLLTRTRLYLHLGHVDRLRDAVQLDADCQKDASLKWSQTIQNLWLRKPDGDGGRWRQVSLRVFAVLTGRFQCDEVLASAGCKLGLPGEEECFMSGLLSRCPFVEVVKRIYEGLGIPQSQLKFAWEIVWLPSVVLNKSALVVSWAVGKFEETVRASLPFWSREWTPEEKRRAVFVTMFEGMQVALRVGFGVLGGDMVSNYPFLQPGDEKGAGHP
eukprot:Cvel_26675.t1-p1 / transcript=Cvel_26675.t1 / gene=Cvel_26675 / organism=Chromera_velia_CCMP2878 / gene_product=hypothetical protein / transcript_product=hypothetical protein / location=Cvel_scaffold3211:17288-18312(+) / protein_length=290 / sequence_SO=supercontig / SO=protein_coding / is_pseudo=false